MFCEKCGTQNKDECKFCIKCGNSLFPEQKQTKSEGQTVKKGVFLFFIVAVVVIALGIMLVSKLAGRVAEEDIWTVLKWGNYSEISLADGLHSFTVNSVDIESQEKVKGTKLIRVQCVLGMSDDRVEAEVLYQFDMVQNDGKWAVVSSQLVSFEDLRPLTGVEDIVGKLNEKIKAEYPNIEWGYEETRLFSTPIIYDFQVNIQEVVRETDLKNKTDKAVYYYEFETYTTRCSGNIEVDYVFTIDGDWEEDAVVFSEKESFWALEGMWTCAFYQTQLVDIGIVSMDFDNKVAAVRYVKQKGKLEEQRIHFDETEECIYFDTFNTGEWDVTLMAEKDDMYFLEPAIFTFYGEEIETYQAIGGKKSSNLPTEVKNITIDIVDMYEITASYNIETKADYLRSALEETQGFTIKGEESQDGFVIDEVNGMQADYDRAGSFWSVYINGEKCMCDIDTQYINDGDRISIKISSTLDRYSIYSPNNKENAGAKGQRSYRNVAIFGVDSITGDLYMGTRSRAIGILSINEKNGQAQIINVPNQMFLQTSQDGKDGQASGAYAYGGATQAVDMLNRNLDLAITDYITIGFEGLIGLVDGVGGIYVYIDEEEVAAWNENPNAKIYITEEMKNAYTLIEEPGYQLVSGMQAANYCLGKIDSNSILGAERQQEVFVAIMDKLRQMDLEARETLLIEVYSDIYTSFTLPDFLGYCAFVLDGGIVGADIFPKDGMRETATLGPEGTCVYTTSLEESVKQLHVFLYEETDYQVSDTVKSIEEKLGEVISKYKK